MAIVKVGATVKMVGSVNPQPQEKTSWLQRMLNKIRRK